MPDALRAKMSAPSHRSSSSPVHKFRFGGTGQAARMVAVGAVPKDLIAAEHVSMAGAVAARISKANIPEA